MNKLVVLGLVGLTPATASAETWVSAEVPTAFAVSAVQEQVFHPGAMPAVGGYMSFGRFALGARLRAGVLRDGAAPADHMADPGAGGLATAGLAGRVQLGDGWIELVGGGGITGNDAVPVFEAGAGWMFDVKGLAIGPSVRYLRVVAASTDAFGSADLVLVGADLQFGHSTERVPHRVVVTAEPPPAPAVRAAPVFDPDDDRILDSLSGCDDVLESVDVDSHCGPPGSVIVEGDHIILDERVMFDTDHARVRSAGREIIRAIARAAVQHPEWQALTIEGHADARGDDYYNQELSQRRADHARDVLIRAGFPEQRVTAVGYGRTRPRDPGTSEEAHQHNRRVEFVIDRSAP